MMRWARLLIVLLALAPAAPAGGQMPTDSATAVQVATRWLELLDRGEFARSWEEADPAFQRQMSATEWGGLIRTVRQPMGGFVTRAVYRVFRSTESSRGGGETLVVEFGAEYTELESVVERIVLVPRDGRWRVAAAFIQPPP